MGWPICGPFINFRTNWVKYHLILNLNLDKFIISLTKKYNKLFNTFNLPHKNISQTHETLWQMLFSKSIIKFRTKEAKSFSHKWWFYFLVWWWNHGENHHWWSLGDCIRNWFFNELHRVSSTPKLIITSISCLLKDLDLFQC